MTDQSLPSSRIWTVLKFGGTSVAKPENWAVIAKLAKARIKQDKPGGKVLIVHYKSDRPAPENLDGVPPAYVAQLALYREIMRPLEPDADIGAALVWTDTARLMPVPGERLDAVLAQLNRAGSGERITPAEAPAGAPFA